MVSKRLSWQLGEFFIDIFVTFCSPYVQYKNTFYIVKLLSWVVICAIACCTFIESWIKCYCGTVHILVKRSTHWLPLTIGNLDVDINTVLEEFFRPYIWRRDYILDGVRCVWRYWKCMFYWKNLNHYWLNNSPPIHQSLQHSLSKCKKDSHWFLPHTNRWQTKVSVYFMNEFLHR